MNGFPILPILLILYLLVVSGGKKKDRKRQRPARAASKPQEGCARARQTAQMDSAGSARSQSAPVPEGEDPCHPVPVREPEAKAQEPEQEKDALAQDVLAQDVLAQDVLRGVIMSEILTRPCERRARNRRGYHG